MDFESTITDLDLDPSTRKFAESFCDELTDVGPNYSIDGMSESIGQRLLHALGLRKSS